MDIDPISVISMAFLIESAAIMKNGMRLKFLVAALKPHPPSRALERKAYVYRKSGAHF